MENRFVIMRGQMAGKEYVGFIALLPGLLKGNKVALISRTTQKALDTIELWREFSLRCLKRDIIPQSNIYYRDWEVMGENALTGKPLQSFVEYNKR